MKLVIKRDGTSQLFDADKIKSALAKAFASVNKVMSALD